MQRTPPNRQVDALRTEQQIGQYYAFVEEVLFRGSSHDASRCLADDFVEHGSTGERSRAEFLASFAARRARFPEAAWTIDLLSSEGNLVVCHTTMVTVEESGARVRVQETAVMRFAAGKIVECWRTFDERLLGNA
ncbi:MAG: SnoaL-like polyketide cyclase [Gemmatimonadetes bacterium]|nr:SnoaL-like polyketide cyclase [Gemmatimonadota bacterium]